MKHKITVREYDHECSDGCCSEYGYEMSVDGELVHRGPCADSGWMAVLSKLGIDAELIGLDKDGEKIWSL